MFASAKQARPKTVRTVSLYLLQYEPIVLVADGLGRDMALTLFGLFEKRMISWLRYQGRVPGYVVLQILERIAH
jgi:hypothetical protein